MAKPGSSIAGTPGSGATLATHLVSSKEYPVYLPTDAQGHVRGDRDVYVVTATDLAWSFPTEWLVLFNADATGVEVDVIGATFSIYATSAASGTARGVWRIQGISAYTGGTSLTPVAFDTSSPALDADITAAHTVTSVTPVSGRLALISLPDDELSSRWASDLQTIKGAAATNLFSETFFGQPIRLRQDEGVAVRTVTNGGAGNVKVDVSLYFRMR